MKTRLSPHQAYWLGQLTGHYVDNDGNVTGSRGFGEAALNPGRALGAEACLENMQRRGLVVWLNGIDGNYHNGFVITELGVQAWLEHFPDRPHTGRPPAPTPRLEPRPKRTQRAVARAIRLPTLSLEEWQHLATTFEGANDPITAAIATKAMTIIDIVGKAKQ